MIELSYEQSKLLINEEASGNFIFIDQIKDNYCIGQVIIQNIITHKYYLLEYSYNDYGYRKPNTTCKEVIQVKRKIIVTEWAPKLGILN